MDKLIVDYVSTTDVLEKNMILAKIIEGMEQSINYFVLKYSNIQMDKEDIKSELLIVLYKCCDNFNINLNISFKTYISKCFDQKCLNLYRDSRNEKKAFKDEKGEVLYNISLDGLRENGDVFEVIAICSEYEDVEIKLLLESMNLESDERVICEGYIKGFSKGEIAIKLGVSNGTITYKTKKLQNKFENIIYFG